MYDVGVERSTQPSPKQYIELIRSSTKTNIQIVWHQVPEVQPPWANVLCGDPDDV